MVDVDRGEGSCTVKDIDGGMEGFAVISPAEMPWPTNAKFALSESGRALSRTG